MKFGARVETLYASWPAHGRDAFGELHLWIWRGFSAPGAGSEGALRRPDAIRPQRAGNSIACSARPALHASAAENSSAGASVEKRLVVAGGAEKPANKGRLARKHAPLNNALMGQSDPGLSMNRRLHLWNKSINYVI